MSAFTFQTIPELIAAEDASVLEGLDFEPACEGRAHATGRAGHVPDQSATWLFQSPCITQLKCDGWVQEAIRRGRVGCDNGGHHDLRDCTLTPLKDSLPPQGTTG